MSYAGERVLVTGASGFIGRALVDRLLTDGAEVHAVSRREQPVSGSEVRWWQADLAEGAQTAGLVESIKPGVVFHLASYVSGGRDLPLVSVTLQSNLVSTVNLLVGLAEHGCRSLVLAGSMEEPLDGDGTPGSPYAAAKWASSGYARMFHALYGLPVTTARIHMTYGPGQADRAKLIPYVTERLLRGEPPQLTSGDRLVDWVYVDDVVEGLLAVGLHPEAAGRTVDLGSGQLASIRRAARAPNCGMTAGFASRTRCPTTEPMEHSRVADISASGELIGWQPATSLEEGLARTVDWYRANPALQPALTEGGRGYASETVYPPPHDHFTPLPCGADRER